MLKAEQDTTGFDFPDELSMEAKAISAVRDQIDGDVNFRELLDAQIAETEEWITGERKHRKRVYLKLQRVYEIYVLAVGNPKHEARIERRCKAAGLAVTGASHVAIQLVKLLLRPADKSVYQYAAALRYAVLKKILVGNLAAALAKDGGIAEFAERFWHKASKLSSDTADDTEDNGDASEEASGSGKDRSSKGRKYDQSPEAIPEFKWNDRALKLYARATNGERIRQIAEKSPGGRWIVIEARAVR